jgi:hypothetical protein
MTTSPTDELRQAAATLRASRFSGAMTATPAVAALLRAREPIADWLEHEAEITSVDHLYAEREPCGWCGTPANGHALAVARQILAASA